MAQHQILMVDNSLGTAKIVSRLVEKKIDDCYVTVCTSAQEALEQLSEKRFELVTSSMLLPDLNALDFAKKVRQLPKRNHIPFIIVSGNIDSNIIEPGFKAGVTGFFNKQDGHNALISYLDSLLPKKETFAARVLYVEDSKTAALRASRFLHTSGFDITHTDNAEHALELMAEKKAPKKPAFDIVVTDIMLNGEMTGYDLIRHIRGCLHYDKSYLPIIIASSEDADIEDILYSGANDFISKPIHENLFNIRLRGLLAIRDKEASSRLY